MRGDTNTEDCLEGDDHGKSEAATASGERRPSITTLQNMLKKVSQSPFHNQYKTLGSPTSDFSATSVDKSQNKQNGVNGDTDKINPFYNYYLEPGSKPPAVNDTERKTSEDAKLNTIFAPPPEFQSTPVDVKPRHTAYENGNQLSQPQKDAFQNVTPNPVKDLFQKSSLGQNTSARGSFYDVTLNSPDLFKANPTQSLSKSLERKGFPGDEVDDIFRPAKKEVKDFNVFDKSSSIVVDRFGSPSNEEDDVFESPQPSVANLFSTASTSKDLFQAVPSQSEELFPFRGNKQDPFSEEKDQSSMFSKGNLDIFSSFSTNAVDPFPSPIKGDLFQDVSTFDDPFGPTPSKQNDPFLDLANRTSGIFQARPSLTRSKDVFVESPKSTSPKGVYSTFSFNSPSEMDDQLLKSTPSGPPTAPKTKSFSRLNDIVLTTPEGTKYDILQPTPFVRARNLALSVKRSPTEINHVPTIKRPPKPLPRTKPPRSPEKPPTPEMPSPSEKPTTPEMPSPSEKPPPPERPPKPIKAPLLAKPVEPEAAAPKLSPKAIIRRLSKPVISRKPKTPERKLVEPENFVVFEDILLIGQEKCVEDWPEDSPEVNTDFKPSGKLRLRRESLKMRTDPDGGSGEDASLSQSKKKEKKFRMSLIPRRESKYKISQNAKEDRSRTMSLPRKSSKEYFSEPPMPGEDGEQEVMDYKKTKVGTPLGPHSPYLVPEEQYMNGYLPQESNDDGINKKIGKNNSIRRWSEGTALDHSSGEEEVDTSHKEKSKKKMKIKFVPQRGFAITREKHLSKPDDEPKGAYGYTPGKGSKGDAFDDLEEMKSYSPHAANKAAFMEEDFYKTQRSSPALSGDEDVYGMEHYKPEKKQKKIKFPFIHRSSKEYVLDDSIQKKNSFSAEDLDDDELYAMEISKTRGAAPFPSKYRTASQNGLQQDYFAEDFLKPGETFDSEQDELETRKPKKAAKSKGLKKSKAKNKSMYQEYEDPPRAASADFLSEAAQAEWMAAQRDEEALNGFQDGDADGDTDSLMEWWYTVEQWDEVPSDEEDVSVKEDESKSFIALADKTHRGLRLFNKAFTERAEVLWQSSITLNALAEDLSDFHHKAKIAGITGGTTTAVGGVTAIAGLALAPFTFGASLVVTAVGVGVAAAGGIASASAAISDNVNNMQDRKKVEVVLQEYETHLLTIGKILHFVDQGFYRLRGHPFLRSGTQHYSEDWEVRKAVQMIGLVDSPVRRAADITDTAVASVQGLFKGTDKYFIKESGELKKSCKKELVALVKEVAAVLHETVVELNNIREELQDATGDM